MMIRTNLTDINRYFCMGRGISLSLDFIKNNDLMSLPIGRYPIDGTKIFALIQEVSTVTTEYAPFENHFYSADMQMTLSGEEHIGYCPISKLVKTGDYNTTTDVQNYIGTADCTMRNEPNSSISIFFPEDGHQPYVAINNPQKIKKIVIRIAMEYFDN